MSFLRTTFTARSCLQGTRRYASTASPSGGYSSRDKFAVASMTAGIVGLGSYIYLTRKGGALELKSPLDPENFVDYKLKKIIPYNHNTSTFVFEIPSGEPSRLPITSCIIVKSSDPEALLDKKGKPIIRPYTPVSPSDAPGVLSLLIKKYDNGNASKHIHSLKEGDTLAIKGPIPKFEYKENEFDEIAMIGGGSGITPLYQLAQHALRSPTNKTKFKLIFSNVAEKDILLREDLDTLAKRYPKTFEVVYVLDKPQEDWTGPKGYVNAELLKKYVSPATLKEKVKVLVCGPPGQVAAVAGNKAGMKQGEIGGVLKELGYTEDQVYKF